MKKILIICFLSFFFVFNSIYSYPTPTLENTNDCFEPVIGGYAGGLYGDGGQDTNDLSVILGDFFWYTFNTLGNSCKNEHFYASYGQCISVEKPDGTKKVFIYDGSDGGHNKKDIHNILDSENLYPHLTEIYNTNTSFFDLSGEYKIKSSYVTEWEKPEKHKKEICPYYVAWKRKWKHAKGYYPASEKVYATLTIRNLKDVLNRVYIPQDWNSKSTIIYCNNINSEGLEPVDFPILAQLSNLYKGCLIKNLDKEENNTILVGFKKSSYHDISNVDKNEELSFLFSYLGGIELEESNNIKNTKISKNPFDDDETKVEYDETLQRYIDIYKESFQKIRNFESNLNYISNGFIDDNKYYIKNIYYPNGTIYDEFYLYQYEYLDNSLDVFKDDFNRVIADLLENQKKATYEEKYKHLGTIKELNLTLFDEALNEYLQYMLNEEGFNNVNNFTHYTLLFPDSLEEEYKFYEGSFKIDEEEYIIGGLTIEEALNNFIDKIKEDINSIGNSDSFTEENKESIINNLGSYDTSKPINTIEEYEKEEIKIIEYTNELLEDYSQSPINIESIGSELNNLKLYYISIINNVYSKVFNTVEMMRSQTFSQTDIENSLTYIYDLIDKKTFETKEPLTTSLTNLITLIESYENSKDSLNVLYDFDDSIIILEDLFETGILKIQDFKTQFDIPYYYECGDGGDVNNCFYKVEKVYSNERSELSNIPLIFKFNNFKNKNENNFRKVIYDNILTQNMVDLSKNVLSMSSASSNNGIWSSPSSCNSVSTNYILKAKQSCNNLQVEETRTNQRCSGGNTVEERCETDTYKFVVANHKIPSVEEGDSLGDTSIDGITFKTYNILKKYPINYYKKDFQIDEINYSFEYDDVSTFFILKNFDNVDLFQKNENNKLLADDIRNKIDSLGESNLAYISINTPNENLNLSLNEKIDYEDTTEKFNVEVNKKDSQGRISSFYTDDCNMLTKEDSENIDCSINKISYENKEGNFQNFFFNFMDVISNLFAKN